MTTPKKVEIELKNTIKNEPITMESNYHKRTKIQRKNNQRQLVKQSI